MTKDEVIRTLCQLVTDTAVACYGQDRPHDCFCTDNPHVQTVSVDKDVIAFIQQATVRALAAERGERDPLPDDFEPIG